MAPSRKRPEQSSPLRGDRGLAVNVHSKRKCRTTAPFRHGRAVEPCTEVKSYRLRVPAKKVLLIAIAAPATFHVTSKEFRGAAE
jgi:hypothetical protein